MQKWRSNIASLTGLRFWAAFCILLHHLLLGFVPRGTLFESFLASCGTIGMNLFFILSGFIIHYNYRDALWSFTWQAYYKFLSNRIARLYPLFIVLFLFELATTSIRLPPEKAVATVASFLTMTQSWFYWQVTGTTELAIVFPRTSIAWSISTEMLMYVVYPALLWPLTKCKPLSRSAGLMLFISFVLGISLMLGWANGHGRSVIDKAAVYWAGPSVGMAAAGGSSFAIWLTYNSPYFRIFEFMIGMAIAHITLKPHTRSESVVCAFAGAASIGFITLSLLPIEYAPRLVLELKRLVGYYPFIAVVVLTCARLPSSWITRFFSMPRFTLWGEYSYSIYLSHIYVYALLAAHPESFSGGLLRIVTAWAAVATFSYLLFSYVEQPGRKWVRRWSDAAWASIVHNRSRRA